MVPSSKLTCQLKKSQPFPTGHRSNTCWRCVHSYVAWTRVYHPPPATSPGGFHAPPVFSPWWLPRCAKTCWGTSGARRPVANMRPSNWQALKWSLKKIRAPRFGTPRTRWPKPLRSRQSFLRDRSHRWLFQESGKKVLLPCGGCLNLCI